MVVRPKSWKDPKEEMLIVKRPNGKLDYLLVRVDPTNNKTTILEKLEKRNL